MDGSGGGRPGCVMVFVVVAVMLGMAYGWAQEGAGHRPEDMAIHKQFYNTWMMPKDRRASCCHQMDCAPAEAYRANGHWMARKVGDDTQPFLEVPQNAEEHERSNPDGRNHLCAIATSVFCFIAGSGT